MYVPIISVISWYWAHRDKIYPHGVRKRASISLWPWLYFIVLPNQLASDESWILSLCVLTKEKNNQIQRGKLFIFRIVEYGICQLIFFQLLSDMGSNAWSIVTVALCDQRVQNQSGTKPNLVAKILATKIGNLWALATKIGSQNSWSHHLVNTWLDVDSLIRCLPIKVANTSKIDKFKWFIARRLQMAPSNCNHL